MMLKTRIIERGITSVIYLVVYILAGLYACVVQAQPLQTVAYTSDHPLAQHKTAGKAVKVDLRVNIEGKAIPINSTINGAYEELKPVLAPCGKRLYFSRIFHPHNTYGKTDSEDIWYTEFDTPTGEWSEPIRVTGVLNNAGPNFINNVSVTGDTIILGNQYLKKGKMRAGVSYSVNVNGKWSDPVAISIKNDYNISNHANHYVSLKNGIIISAIQRVETVGKRDLYVSFWNGKSATEPINMGPVINTEMDESSPFLAADNKTLYFASKGHNGYGGYDVWVTQRLDDSWTNWTEPKNLGPAVNSSLDDEFFSITHCKNFAVFSRRISIHNTDIFRISMEELLGKPEQKKLKGPNVENSALASL
jgi:hypothetical protein